MISGFIYLIFELFAPYCAKHVCCVFSGGYWSLVFMLAFIFFIAGIYQLLFNVVCGDEKKGYKMKEGIYIKFDKPVRLEADKTYYVGIDGNIKELEIIEVKANKEIAIFPEVFPEDEGFRDSSEELSEAIPSKKPYKHNAKISYLEKWILNGSFTVFTLDQFLAAYPKQKNNKNLKRNFFRLLKTKKIAQLDGNDRYMVAR